MMYRLCLFIFLVFISFSGSALAQKSYEGSGADRAENALSEPREEPVEKLANEAGEGANATDTDMPAEKSESSGGGLTNDIDSFFDQIHKEAQSPEWQQSLCINEPEIS